jgi:hypothetical protein
MRCSCGEDHPAGDLSLTLAGSIPILVPERNIAYRVPKVYIAFHGIKAAELAELAQRYDWEPL